MVKILKCLLILNLLTWSNVYAWYCTYTPTSEGYITEGSTVCYGIDVDTAIETVWCTAYQPSDPICQNYSTCSDQTEQRSIACTDPNTTGLVNESRIYTCSTDSWSDWVVSSNNCVALPQTCFESVEERTVGCQEGYTGTISEQRLTTCSTPYSQPSIGQWTMVSDQCKLKATDPTSVESPLNPASPLSMDQQQLDQVGTTSEMTNPMTNNPMTQPQVDMSQTEQQEEHQKTVPTKTNEAEPKSTTKLSTSSSPSETKKENKKKAKQEAKIKVKDNEEIIPGFGVAISFALIEQPVMFQQQGLTNILSLEQEQDYAREQNFLLNIIQSDDYTSAFDSLADFRWRSLLHDYPLQQDAFGN
jgi:hypothetical protein